MKIKKKKEKWQIIDAGFRFLRQGLTGHAYVDTAGGI